MGGRQQCICLNSTSLQYSKSSNIILLIFHALSIYTLRCWASPGKRRKGWMGWGGDDDVFCTCTHVKCYATDGLGVGSSFFISSEKKQASFIPTRPPTTYVNTRLVDYWWCSLPAVCKTQLWHIKLQSKWSPGAIYMLYTTVSPRSVADWGGGVYFNKEQRWGGVGWGWWRILHLHTCEMLHNWWEWWRILHLHTCEMLRNWWGGDDDVSWTCCEHEKTADCQPLNFSTSFKFTAPANVFVDTRQIRGKTCDFWQFFTSWTCCKHEKPADCQPFCMFAQASNLPHPPVLLKTHA